MTYVETVDCDWLSDALEKRKDYLDDADYNYLSNNANQSLYYYPQITFFSYWFCSQEYHIHNALKTWAPPIMIVSGSVGNVIAFVVLSRHNVRQWSICVYLAAFAFCNTLVLYVGCGLDWIAHITETPYVANRADWICRLWQFLFNVIIYTASWLVVAMMIDRFVAVCLPSKTRVVCTVFISKIVCILIIVLLVVISIHAMWTYELTPNGCYIDPAQQDFQSVSWPYISATLYSYVPLISIAVLCTIVLCALMSPKVRKEHTTNNKIQLTFTITTLIVSYCYMLMSLPTVVINFVEYNRPEWQRDYKKLSQVYLARTIGQTIACLSHSVSYIIYFLMVPLFRKEFMSMVKRLCAARQTVTDRQAARAEVHSICVNGETKHEDVVTTLL